DETRQQAPPLVRDLVDRDHPRTRLFGSLWREARHRLHRRDLMGGPVRPRRVDRANPGRPGRCRVRQQRRPAGRQRGRPDLLDPDAGTDRRFGREGRRRGGLHRATWSLQRARVLDDRRRGQRPDPRPSDLRRRHGLGRHPALYRLRIPQHAEPDPLRRLRDRGNAARRAGRGRRLLDPGRRRRRRDRCPLRDGAVDGDRVLGPRHDRRLRPHPGEPGPPARRLLRGGRQLQPRPDARPLHQHLDHRHLHAPRALPLRRHHHPRLCPRPPDRRDQRHLLFDLQRQPTPGRLGERGDSALLRPLPPAWSPAGGGDEPV
ncbi:MAG: Protein translocase subunit SecF, partial [uncultured Thermomicrobiales bacterium]